MKLIRYPIIFFMLVAIPLLWVSTSVVLLNADDIFFPPDPGDNNASGGNYGANPV